MSVSFKKDRGIRFMDKTARKMRRATREAGKTPPAVFTDDTPILVDGGDAILVFPPFGKAQK